VLGNQAEAQQPTQIQSVQNCNTQTYYQNQTAYYDVVYEYAGRRYQVQMANDPGRTVPVQVTPVGSLPAQPAVRAPARIISSTTYVQPAVEQVVVQQPTTVYQTAPIYQAAPVYTTPSYVAPLAIGLSLGYIGGHYSHRSYGPPRYYGRPHWR
jgi:hypothetical protein